MFNNGHAKILFRLSPVRHLAAAQDLAASEGETGGVGETGGFAQTKPFTGHARLMQVEQVE